jgi:endonuclease/exonuclease/phosphatase family metal-dependent hydrolase
MRRAESGLLRRHINQLLEQQPETHLVVYGDFNDTRRTPTLRTAMGRFNSPTGLIVLHPVDSRGERWTHYWAREDIYSRFDYVMVSKPLEPYIDQKNMRILDPANWYQASDHRAILVPIR